MKREKKQSTLGVHNGWEEKKLRWMLWKLYFLFRVLLWNEKQKNVPFSLLIFWVARTISALKEAETMGRTNHGDRCRDHLTGIIEKRKIRFLVHAIWSWISAPNLTCFSLCNTVIVQTSETWVKPPKQIYACGFHGFNIKTVVKMKSLKVTALKNYNY